MLTIIFWPAPKNISVIEKVTLIQHALSQLNIGRETANFRHRIKEKYIIVFYIPTYKYFQDKQIIRILKFACKILNFILFILIYDDYFFLNGLGTQFQNIYMQSF